MLEGRGSNAAGWIIVGLAAVALVAFTGLLYIRGGSGNSAGISLPVRTPGPAGSDVAARPSSTPGPSASASASSPRPTARSSAAASSANPSAASSGAVAGATSRPSAAATRSPRPSPSPAVSPLASPSGRGYRLPASPQPATVALTNGQGGCPSYPTDGVVVETTFTVSSGRLTAISPSGHRLSGQLKPDGSFSVSGSSPVERWIGTLTGTGGSGSYFVVSKGCTEGYDSTIAFHP